MAAGQRTLSVSGDYMEIEEAKRPSIALLAAIVMASVVTLLGGSMVLSLGPHLVSVLLQQRYVDLWTLLTALVVVTAVGGVVGAWISIRRDKPFRAMALVVLPLVTNVLVGAQSCDYYPTCASTDWARLPASAFEWSFPQQEKPRVSKAPPLDIKVLDGDTLLFNGKVVRIAGIDAPELGQTAKCWAEAALGGESRNALKSALEASGPAGPPEWELAEASPPDRGGRIRANLITKDGLDVQDHMVVYGHAARTDGRWDWCGADDLHSPREGEPLPHGPNMWWPADHIYDSRAAD